VASSPGFCDHILDLLAPLGGVSARAMFGGFGLYRGGVIFALISGDSLYFKADDGLRAEFEDNGMAQFRPRQRGRPFPMPYFLAPPDALEEPDMLMALARKSLAAAVEPEMPARKGAGHRHAKGRPAKRPGRTGR
jgi:DNA transformation protein